MSVKVLDLTATELDALFGEDLPCARVGMDCTNPGAWEAALGCGHRGLLCDAHHDAAIQREEKKRQEVGAPPSVPLRWFCLTCNKHFAVEWRRL